MRTYSKSTCSDPVCPDPKFMPLPAISTTCSELDYCKWSILLKMVELQVVLRCKLKKNTNTVCEKHVDLQVFTIPYFLYIGNFIHWKMTIVTNKKACL